MPSAKNHVRSAKNHCQFTSADGTRERACCFCRLCLETVSGDSRVIVTRRIPVDVNTGIEEGGYRVFTEREVCLRIEEYLSCFQEDCSLDAGQNLFEVVCHQNDLGAGGRKLI